MMQQLADILAALIEGLQEVGFLGDVPESLIANVAISIHEDMCSIVTCGYGFLLHRLNGHVEAWHWWRMADYGL